MARNKWTETSEITYDVIDDELVPLYGEPYRYTMSLGKGLVKIIITKVNFKWLRGKDKLKTDEEIKKICNMWHVYINRTRMRELEGENIEEVMNSCLDYIETQIKDTADYFKGL